jgi:Ca-activated chloride channel homolog
MVLQSIDEHTVGVAGTDLGRVIDVADGAFERGGTGSHVLVLITDGEDNEGRGLAAATAAAGEMRILPSASGPNAAGPFPKAARATRTIRRAARWSPASRWKR